MTNINCSSDCIHQHDGKCCLEKLEKDFPISNKDCTYFKSVDTNKQIPNKL